MLIGRTGLPRWNVSHNPLAWPGSLLSERHIWPAWDLKPHILEGEECWCSPHIYEDNGVISIEHHALDRRERSEERGKSDA
jgi:hypothetical protein